MTTREGWAGVPEDPLQLPQLLTVGRITRGVKPEKSFTSSRCLAERLRFPNDYFHPHQPNAAN